MTISTPPPWNWTPACVNFRDNSALTAVTAGFAAARTRTQVAGYEETLPRPNTVYASTEQAAEALGLDYRALFDLDIVALRLAGVFGPSRQGGGLGTHTLRSLQHAALDGREVVVPRLDIDWIYAIDAARTLSLACWAESIPSRVLNVSSGVLTTAEGPADIISRLEPSADVRLAPEGAPLAGAITANTDRACERTRICRRIRHVDRDATVLRLLAAHERGCAGAGAVKLIALLSEAPSSDVLDALDPSVFVRAVARTLHSRDLDAAQGGSAPKGMLLAWTRDPSGGAGALAGVGEQVSLVTERVVLACPQVPEALWQGPIRVGLLYRAPGLSQEQFMDAYLAHGDLVLAHGPLFAQYVINLMLDTSRGWDAVVEQWFDSAEVWAEHDRQVLQDKPAVAADVRRLIGSTRQFVGRDIAARAYGPA